ncbi:MAG: hypothetical protein KGJ77_12665, partial [Acidobacteriota bacterium]|nr:hypothetical protein [Acidobacteriota bacterium]
MKRYPAVIAATAAGLAGILSFHSRGTSQLSAALPVSARTDNRPTTTTTVPAPVGTGPTTTTGPAPVGTVPTTTSAPPTSASALGTTEQYGYGELAVRLTVSGSKITDA